MPSDTFLTYIKPPPCTHILLSYLCMNYFKILQNLYQHHHHRSDDTDITPTEKGETLAVMRRISDCHHITFTISFKVSCIHTRSYMKWRRRRSNDGISYNVFNIYFKCMMIPFWLLTLRGKLTGNVKGQHEFRSRVSFNVCLDQIVTVDQNKTILVSFRSRRNLWGAF